MHVAHVRNFIDCLKTRSRPISDIEIGHRSTSAPHLANIALKVGRKIEWDWKKEEILGDQEASKFLTKEYRQPWEGVGPRHELALKVMNQSVCG